MSPLRLYLGVVVAVFVLLLLVVPLYFDSRGEAVFERRFGAPWEAAVAAAGAALLVVVGLGVVGASPLGSGGSRLATRRHAAAVVFASALLVAGTVGVVVGASNLRTVVRFLRRGDEPTGGVEPGPVAVTGTVEAADPPRSPLFGTGSVAWEWRVGARNRHGLSNDAWETARVGAGGTPFALDDGSGPVRVDPAGARLDLDAETVEELPAGVRPGPTRADDERLDLGFGGDRWRFRERALTPGTEVTVLGTALEREDGGERRVVVADGDPETPFVLTVGSRTAAVRRYVRRAAGFGVGGVLAALVALGLLVRLLSV